MKTTACVVLPRLKVKGNVKLKGNIKVKSSVKVKGSRRGRPFYTNAANCC